MTDRDLLDLAAKAAGHEYTPNFFSKTGFYWNPLVEDSDALRLAVKLGLMVCIESSRTLVIPEPPAQPVDEPFSTDPCAATRRAIVRAAAAIAQEAK